MSIKNIIFFKPQVDTKLSLTLVPKLVLFHKTNAVKIIDEEKAKKNLVQRQGNR